eukprot:scaffold5322_cov88-Cylindrotheca_fusiformis.AAC.3
MLFFVPLFVFGPSIQEEGRKYGKAMILPDHATVEEFIYNLLIKNCFVEGQLETVAWKESMPMPIIEIIEDVDAIFRINTPCEIVKDEGSNLEYNQHKDYIELQAQKEQTQIDTRTSSNYMMYKKWKAQEKGHERYIPAVGINENNK